MAKSKIKFGGTFANHQAKSKIRKITYPSGPPNLERDAKIELNEVQQAFREAAQKEAKLKEDNTNADFFSVVVFKSREQRDQFLDLLAIKSPDNQYIDGQKLIHALKLKIELLEPKDPGKFRCNAEILNLALDI